MSMQALIRSQKLHLALSLSCAVVLAAHAQRAVAQAPAPPQGQQAPKPAQAPPAQQPQQQQTDQRTPQATDQPDIDEKRTEVPNSNIVVEPHMQPDERPEPPQSEPVQTLQQQEQAPVATGAGVGSDIAYASQGVVELGGTLSLTHQSQTTTFRLAPSVGYFLVDNIELTLFPELMVINIDGEEDDETDVSVGGALEPSYHVPFSDRLLGFIGIGLGVRYADEPGVDVFLRPRLGMDILVGRSGILKPAAFVDIGANDGLTSGGIEVGFTVML